MVPYVLCDRNMIESADMSKTCVLVEFSCELDLCEQVIPILLRPRLAYDLARANNAPAANTNASQEVAKSIKYSFKSSNADPDITLFCLRSFRMGGYRMGRKQALYTLKKEALSEKPKV